MRLVLCGILVTLLGCSQAKAHIDFLGNFVGLGILASSTVAPGSVAGSERLYQSYIYSDRTLDIVAVDPETGSYKVFENPAPTESGAWSITAGPDGNVYLGTLPTAHFLKLDTKAGKLLDLGRPSQTENYIWDVTFGSDGKLYGATYPQAKLVRYDPSSGRLEDLGRMDPSEKYARYVAGSDDGFIYVGIGTSKANVAAYEISTGRHQEIFPPDAQVLGQAKVYRGEDGRVYGTIAGRYFMLEQWVAKPIGSAEASRPKPTNHLLDGRIVEVGYRKLRVANQKSGAVAERSFAYKGNSLTLFRIGLGPDGHLYGSSTLPAYLVKLDRKKHTLTALGEIGNGEVYSFLAHDRQLLMANYVGLAPLMKFETAKPFSKGTGEKNPALVTYQGMDGAWRPMAMINGPKGLVYIGAVAGYGKLGGPLAMWSPETGGFEQFNNIVSDQSVVTLTVWKNRIVGGTTVEGGGGSHPTQKEAKLFIFNPENRKKEFEVVPVPGAGRIDDLVTAPNGLVYGIAGETLFVYDPASRSVKARKHFPFSSVVYNSAAVGPDGRIWGLASEGIFAIDTETNELSMMARSPEKITAGFALQGNEIFFVSGAAVYRYTIGEP